MTIKIRIETPIAFALTLTVSLVLFFYCWRIRKLRYRISGSVQVSALPIADTIDPVSSLHFPLDQFVDRFCATLI